MSVADKLLQINQVKQDIKAAIETKGVPMTSVAFTEYANKILEISGGGDEYYYYYAKDYYTETNNATQFQSAWEHSLTVDPSEISSAQYPNGETEGVIIPYKITSIGDFAFGIWVSNNQPLVIPNSVTSIENYAFGSWSSNNQPLVIPNSVTSIGNSAFFKWNSNTHPLVIPNSVTSIESYAFYNWELVPYVEIQAITPPTLEDSDAFDGQNNAPIYVPDESVEAYKTAPQWSVLASRIFPMSDKEYFVYAKDYYTATNNLTLFESAWEHSLTVDPLEISKDSSYQNYRGMAQYPDGETEGVIIPHGVTTIGAYTFAYWSANKQPLIIPNSVTNIRQYAFSGWSTNIHPLVIPNSVTSINTDAFGSWRAHTHPLVIPNSVTSIGVDAFRFWDSIPYVEIQAITPPTLANINAFSYQNDAPIYVPDESVASYKAATNWVSLSSRIFSINDK